MVVGEQLGDALVLLLEFVVGGVGFELVVDAGLAQGFTGGGLFLGLLFFGLQVDGFTGDLGYDVFASGLGGGVDVGPGLFKALPFFLAVVGLDGTVGIDVAGAALGAVFLLTGVILLAELLFGLVFGRCGLGAEIEGGIPRGLVLLKGFGLGGFVSLAVGVVLVGLVGAALLLLGGAERGFPGGLLLLLEGLALLFEFLIVLIEGVFGIGHGRVGESLRFQVSSYPHGRCGG